jgi:hypothetical protein
MHGQLIKFLFDYNEEGGIDNVLIKIDLLALLTIVNFVSLSNLSIHYMSFRIAKQFSGI